LFGMSKKCRTKTLLNNGKWIEFAWKEEIHEYVCMYVCIKWEYKFSYLQCHNESNT
jgi:hypothetical protein